MGGPHLIQGGKNTDWESICNDQKGHLWIRDVGNNQNNRKDLKVYKVEEPGETIPKKLSVLKTLRILYRDQDAFPPVKMNFDCEALFYWNEHLYLLTKHRSDTDTKLFRIEDLKTEEKQVVTLIGRFTLIGQVTGAALHPGGNTLAVLTRIFHEKEIAISS